MSNENWEFGCAFVDHRLLQRLIDVLPKVLLDAEKGSFQFHYYMFKS